MAKCKISFCSREAINLYCDAHYRWVLKIGPEKAANKIIRDKAKNGSGCIVAGPYKLHHNNGISKFEHILKAEKALGKSLPVGATIHHVDGNGLNNANSNLILCPDQAYHSLLHRRERWINYLQGLNQKEGILFRKERRLSWSPYIIVNRKIIYLGSCFSEKEAIDKRKKAISFLLYNEALSFNEKKSELKNLCGA